MRSALHDLSVDDVARRAVLDCVGEGLLAIEGGRVRPTRRALESVWAG